MLQIKVQRCPETHTPAGNSSSYWVIQNPNNWTLVISLMYFIVEQVNSMSIFTYYFFQNEVIFTWLLNWTKSAMDELGSYTVSHKHRNLFSVMVKAADC